MAAEQIEPAGGSPALSVSAMRGVPVTEPTSRLWWTAIAAATTLVIMPLFLTDVPPLLDYPSHLGRITILAATAGDQVRQIWTPSWSPLPNLAMDGVVLGLARIVPLHIAGRISIALALLLPVLGSIALHRALFHRRSWWPVGSFAIAYNGVLLAGFINFLFGLGVALLAAALWMHWIERGVRRRAAAAFLLSVPIYFSHLTALVFFIAILLFIEMSIAARQKQMALTRYAAIMPAFLPLVLLAFAKPMTEVAPEAGLLSGVTTLFFNPLERLRNLVTPFLTYDPLLDLAVIATFLIAVACARWKGLLAFAPGPLLLALALFVVFPIFPTDILGASWVDRRLPMFAVFLLFAAVDPTPFLAGLRSRILLIVIAIAVVRVFFVASVWADWEATDHTDLLAVTAEVMPGKRVLVVRAHDRGHPRLIWQTPRAWQIMVDVDATIHWPILPLVERPAFVPLLHTGHQPIEVKPSFACLAGPDRQPPRWSALTQATEADLRNAPYLIDWQKRFDYVLLLQSGLVPEATALLPDRLTPVIIRRAAALYRVIQTDGAPSWAPDCATPRSIP